MRRTRQPDIISVIFPHIVVHFFKIRNYLVYIFQRIAVAVNQRLGAKQNVRPGMTCYLMSALKYFSGKLRAGFNAAESVLFKIGIVVKFNTAPSRRALPSDSIGIVFRRVANNVKGSARTVFFKRLQNTQRQRLVTVPWRIGGKCARTVVKGHGDNTLFKRHPLDTAHRRQINGCARLYFILKTVFQPFGAADSFCYKRHVFSSSKSENIAKYRVYKID